jgi:PD-(D/E)XK endonuclease
MAGKKRNTKQVGDTSQAMVVAAFVSNGTKVSLPYSENTRYDMIVDDGARLARVQVKTACLGENGAVLCFRVCSQHGHRLPDGHWDRSRHYEGQIDLFAVYSPATMAVYLVPIDKVNSRSMMYLRITASAHANGKKINYADDFKYFQF